MLGPMRLSTDLNAAALMQLHPPRQRIWLAAEAEKWPVLVVVGWPSRTIPCALTQLSALDSDTTPTSLKNEPRCRVQTSVVTIVAQAQSV